MAVTGVPGPEPGRLRKSAPELCWGVVYMHSLWGIVRLDHPKSIWLVNGGSDRLLFHEVSRGLISPATGCGGAALACEMCCPWSPGSGRILPLGTFCRRREEGWPIMAPGSGLTHSKSQEEPDMYLL